jgi:hypothetical protein
LNTWRAVTVLITLAFARPLITHGACVAAYANEPDDLYEQCSFHIAENRAGGPALA